MLYKSNIFTAVVLAGLIGIKTRISSSIFEVGAGLILANALGIHSDEGVGERRARRRFGV